MAKKRKAARKVKRKLKRKAKGKAKRKSVVQIWSGNLPPMKRADFQIGCEFLDRERPLALHRYRQAHHRRDQAQSRRRSELV